MSGCIGNGHGINAWEFENSEELRASRNHIARLLNQEVEGAYEIDEVDEVPVMPFGPYKNKPLDQMNIISLCEHYKIGAFDPYNDCKDWIEKHLKSYI